MKYGVYSQNQWLFPDMQPCAGVQSVSLALLKGQSGGFQMLIQGLKPGAAIGWQAEDLPDVRVEAFREIAVKVNRNTNNLQNGNHTTDDWEEISRFRVRRAPYYVFDPLESLDGLNVRKDTEAFYFTFMPQPDAVPGVYTGKLILSFAEEKIIVPVEMQVCAANLPETSLHLTNWFSIANMARDHHLQPGSPEHWAMIEKYIQTMRGCHQDIFWVTWENLKVERVDGRLRFDFSEIKKTVEFFLKFGFRKIEWAHIISRNSWDEAAYYIDDATCPGKRLECLTTGLKYLTAFLKQLHAFIVENGWQDISMVHVCDEPREHSAADYRILAGIYRKYLPGIRLMDAVEIFLVQEALDIYVPKNHYFQMFRNEFEALRDEDNELWFYTCNNPGGKFLNRFLDSPLLHPRLLHWGNFRYHLTGYLHWGYNQLRENQDPYEETSGDVWLPAGDTHIVYPAPEGPLRSMRYEQMKAGVEDYELLKTLAQTDPDRAKELCRRCFVAFDDYVTDLAAFEQTHRSLTLAVETALCGRK